MKQFIVDAFTDKAFAGNPAAICILEEWVSDELMMLIAAENNLSETAFAVKENEGYHLRWFTPAGEIDLCGHATLACAYVLLKFYEKNSNSVQFHTMGGDLTVVKKGDFYEMEFPAFEMKKVSVTKDMIEAVGCEPKEAYLGRDLLC
ncbi:MAG: PhzF family phenazine biosynthesis isomerase, partial [Muribaculum sp.]|nr:PhzF family phenazine biosynthesis isomerase [Muribaculum sp.]